MQLDTGLEICLVFSKDQSWVAQGYAGRKGMLEVFVKATEQGNITVEARMTNSCQCCTQLILVSGNFGEIEIVQSKDADYVFARFYDHDGNACHYGREIALVKLSELLPSELLAMSWFDLFYTSSFNKVTGQTGKELIYDRINSNH